MVKLLGRENYITNNDFKIISPNQWFDSVFRFEDGLAGVELDGKYNLITPNGKLVSPKKWFDGVGITKYNYDSAEDSFGENYYVELNGKKYIVHNNNGIISLYRNGKTYKLN